MQEHGKTVTAVTVVHVWCCTASQPHLDLWHMLCESASTPAPGNNVAAINACSCLLHAVIVQLGVECTGVNVMFAIACQVWVDTAQQ